MAPNPRRIVAFPVTAHAPVALSADLHKRLEAGANHCPVHNGIHSEIAAPITFIYE
jgi:hypothetical protein